MNFKSGSDLRKKTTLKEALCDIEPEERRGDFLQELAQAVLDAIRIGHRVEDWTLTQGKVLERLETFRNALHCADRLIDYATVDEMMITVRICRSIDDLDGSDVAEVVEKMRRRL